MLSASDMTVPPLNFFAGDRRNDAFDVLFRQGWPTTSGVPQLQDLKNNNGIYAVAEQVAAQPRRGIVASPFIDPLDHETAQFDRTDHGWRFGGTGWRPGSYAMGRPGTYRR